VRVGQTVEHFTGTLWLDAVTPLTGFDFRADGEGANGLIHGHGRVYLEDAAAGPTAAASATVLCYEADFKVDGPLQNANDRLLTTTARAFARRTLEALERQLELRTRVYTTTVVPRGPDSAAHATVSWQGAARRLATMLGVLVVVALLRRMLVQRQTQRRAMPGVEPPAPAVPLPTSGDDLDRS